MKEIIKQEYDEKGNLTYYEDSSGNWYKRKFDGKGNEVYFESSSGFWIKNKFDEKDNLTYSEDSSGNWIKQEYNEKGNGVYRKYSNGYWEKRKYDESGNVIYYEDSNGKIVDKREIKKYRVWHIPQVPGKPFYILVNNPEEAIRIINILSIYDQFQYKNNIKPDFSNASGFEVYENNKWIEWHDDETDSDIHEYFEENEICNNNLNSLIKDNNIKF